VITTQLVDGILSLSQLEQAITEQLLFRKGDANNEIQ